MQPDQHQKPIDWRYPIGAKIRYMPHKARKNPFDPLCEDGVILRRGSMPGNVLVRFSTRRNPMWVSETFCCEVPGNHDQLTQ